MKTIIELCRELPACEPELRARADEFNLAIEQALQVPTRWGARDYLNRIDDAKAATDAMTAPGLRLRVMSDGQAWAASLSNYLAMGVAVEVVASTEPLARSACALLAANVLSA